MNIQIGLSMRRWHVAIRWQECYLIFPQRWDRGSRVEWYAMVIHLCRERLGRGDMYRLWPLRVSKGDELHDKLDRSQSRWFKPTPAR